MAVWEEAAISAAMDHVEARARGRIRVSDLGGEVMGRAEGARWRGCSCWMGACWSVEVEFGGWCSFVWCATE